MHGHDMHRRHRPGPMGPMAHFGHGPRNRRGEIPAAVLSLLAENDMHGYQMLQEIGDRTGGAWAPSPGSIYPALQALEDQGLVTSERVGGKRVFSLTETGRAKAAELPEGGPWAELAEGDDPHRALRDAFAGLMGATSQIARIGAPEQIAGATEILSDARKKMYAILAGSE